MSQRKKIKKSAVNSRYYLLFVVLSAPLAFILAFMFSKVIKTSQSEPCSKAVALDLVENSSISLSSDFNKKAQICYQFTAKSGQKLIVDTENQIKLLAPSNNAIDSQGVLEGRLTENGRYSIILDTSKSKSNLQLNVRLESSAFAKIQPETKAVQSLLEGSQDNNLLLTFNANKTPPFQRDQRLQNIINKIVSLTESKGLPTNYLSISLVDLSPDQSRCCGYAYYSDQQPRYPASVVKLFWMVTLFAQEDAGVIPPGTVSEKVLVEMIKDSNNEAASQVLDVITKTESGSALPEEEIQQWKAKRYSVNYFFESAGYTNNNLTQKTFPIPFLQMTSPIGRDLQIRDKDLKENQDLKKPIRNYTTTYSVARLLYEIETDQAVSPDSSDRMDNLLQRNLDPNYWKPKPYDSIEGFLGEGLPTNAKLSSKMGWTFNNRNDAAIITSPDGKARYILVVFGDNAAFYEDKQFFPELSRFVYEQMTNPDLKRLP